MVRRPRPDGTAGVLSPGQDQDDLQPLRHAGSLAAVLGYLDWKYFGMMVTVSVLFGVAVTLLAVLMSDVAMRRTCEGTT